MCIHKRPWQLNTILVIIEPKAQVESKVIQILRVELPVLKLDHVISHRALKSSRACVGNEVELESIRPGNGVFNDETLLGVVESSFV